MSSDIGTPTSRDSAYSALDVPRNYQLIPDRYWKKLSKLNQICIPLKSLLKNYLEENKYYFNIFRDEVEMPKYIQYKIDLINRYDNLLKITRNLFAQNIIYYNQRIEEQLISIMCSSIDVYNIIFRLNDTELINIFDMLISIYKDTHIFYRDIWYLSKILISSPPNITKMVNKIHLYIRLCLEMIIISFRKLSNRFNYDNSEVIHFITELFNFQSIYPCSIGRNCKICQKAIKSINIKQEIPVFSMDYINKPPHALCAFELISIRYNQIKDKSECQLTIQKFIQNFYELVPFCLIHCLYSKKDYSQLHHPYNNNNQDFKKPDKLLFDYYKIVLLNDFKPLLVFYI